MQLSDYANNNVFMLHDDKHSTCSYRKKIKMVSKK